MKTEDIFEQNLQQLEGNVQQIAHFRNRAGTYEKRYDFRSITFDFFADQLTKLVKITPDENFKYRNILDFASGTGDLSRYLAQSLNESRIYAVDLTFDMLFNGNKLNISDENPVWVCANGIQLPFSDDKFQFVMMKFALHHFDDSLTKFMLSEIRRVLTTNGFVIVMDVISPEQNPSKDFFKTLNVMREPANRNYRTKTEIQELFHGHGLKLVTDYSKTHTYQICVEKWLREFYFFENTLPFVLNSDEITKNQINLQKVCDFHFMDIQAGMFVFQM